jgi:hypothetical protein
MRIHLFVSAPLMRPLLFVLSVVASFEMRSDWQDRFRACASTPPARLRVGVGPHDPHIGFSFENRCAARSRLPRSAGPSGPLP